MAFDLAPGSAIQCNINSHRHAWNGVICTEAAAWNCGAQADFREEHCARGNPKCFHLHAFDSRDCHVTIEDKGAGWVLEEERNAFDDQILLLYGRPAHEPRGIREGAGADPILFGAYRIQRVAKREAGFMWTLWDVFPYPDAWVRLDALRVRAPYARKMDGPYLKEVEKTQLPKLFREAVERAESPGEKDFSDEQRKRLMHFQSNLPAWIEQAARRREAAGAKVRTVVGPARRSGMSPFNSLADYLGNIRLPDRPAQAPPAAAPAPARPAPSATAMPAAAPLPEPVVEAPRHTVGPVPRLPFVEKGAEEIIAELYGARTLQQIRVGSMTKTLLVLVGAPGAGKSRLAARLLDDPDRRRTCLVAVSSTWRGPEDLLGYVNPISGEFEPTAFTNFLRGADEAWRAGDLRPRLVVFEEFNLSPPEYWLSEVLVRSQYAPDQRADRTIALGGMRVRGWGASEAPNVVLSPNVHFVATVNSDHTTRPFSPRVLDRAALVELRLTPKAALDHAGVTLDEDQVSAIEELDHCLEASGHGFSLRTAVSLRDCQQSLEQLGLTLWEAIDIVLLQEVLSKVRLLVGDTSSMAMLENLRKWTDSHGRNLVGCTSVISDWEERLGAGRDVVQA